jgi:hypothetical protein
LFAVEHADRMRTVTRVLPVLRSCSANAPQSAPALCHLACHSEPESTIDRKPFGACQPLGVAGPSLPGLTLPVFPPAISLTLWPEAVRPGPAIPCGRRPWPSVLRLRSGCRDIVCRQDCTADMQAAAFGSGVRAPVASSPGAVSGNGVEGLVTTSFTASRRVFGAHAGRAALQPVAGPAVAQVTTSGSTRVILCPRTTPRPVPTGGGAASMVVRGGTKCVCET